MLCLVFKYDFRGVYLYYKGQTFLSLNEKYIPHNKKCFHNTHTFIRKIFSQQQYVVM